MNICILLFLYLKFPNKKYSNSHAEKKCESPRKNFFENHSKKIVKSLEKNCKYFTFFSSDF